MSSLGFSYAQAAKGLAPSSNVSSNPTSSASSEHGIKETTSVADSIVTQPKASRLQRSEKESVQQSRPSQATPTSSEAESTSQNDKSLSQTTDSIIDDSKSIGSQRSSADDIASVSKTVESSRHAAVQAAREPEAFKKGASETGDDQDKAKEADDDWEKVSIPSSAAERELRAAPIPVVNIWQQRMETQQAKIKEHSGQRQLSLVHSQNKPQSQNTNVDDTKKKSAVRETANSESARISPGRVNSGGRAPRDQRGNSASPRSVSQQKEPNTARPLPPVDAASWPTPESAIPDAGRRSSLLEKADKTELVDAKPSKKNQWTTLPFVPTVKFETQIPTNRRGGRAANTRGGGRGPTSSHTDRNTERAEPGSMGPPPLPKSASDGDRGRKSNNTRSARDGSVPGEAQREDNVTNQSLAGEIASANTGSASSPAQNLTPIDNASGMGGQPSNGPSRSSSRQAPVSGAVAALTKPESDHASVQNAEVKESPSKQSNRVEKNASAGFDNARLTSESVDRSVKEWSKDRPTKQDSWRSEQRGERSERGRGTYRGRGNRAGYTNASYTTPLPQNGFEVNKNGNAADSRPSRQTSQNFSPGSFNSSRTNTRAHSIPVGMLPGAYFTPPQMFPQQSLAPIQTDMSYNAYNQMPNGVPNGIMSAMPYNEQLNGFALISMVSRQLEYYFSLDNLCKDMFLRKNMDSQGFVLLRVIAEFRRIKSLLGEGSMSFEHLRSVASQVPNVEFVMGEDGEDRLRSRGNWKDFVLPVEERVPQAQNTGPQIKPGQSRQPINTPHDFHMGNGLRSAPPTMNGFPDVFANQHANHFSHGLVSEPQAVEQWSGQIGSPRLEDRRTSVTSPISKVQSPNHDAAKGLFETMTNGHRDSMSSNAPGKENTFPDESVALLKVVVKDPEYQGQEESSMMEESIPVRSSGLRGGAGSPEQFERVRSLQFGQNPVTFKKSGGQAMYFTQGEGPRPELMRPGYIHEDYMTLREQAYNQRSENHSDGALLVLYPLWADFLAVPHQFNVGMYEEFKTWALEDAEKGNNNGKKYLVKFYDAMLGSNNAMTERISNDIINIARAESGSDRQTWTKLRGAWRNGATNLKTRKRLADLLTAEEREELDRNS